MGPRPARLGVLGVGSQVTEGGQQPIELGVARAAEPHGEVRPLAGGQQLEAVAGEPGRRGQVDGAEVREALSEQFFE
jgi:hypothetical protein